jgi:competence protein ComEC
MKCLHKSINSHLLFWEEQPALLLGLCLTIGTSSYLFWSFPWNWIFPILCFFYLLYLRLIPPILILGGGLLYGYLLYPSTPSGKTGYFSIAEKKSFTTPFQKGFMYKGMLYIDKQRVPCSVYTFDPSVQADCDYIVQGALQERAPFQYFFKVKKWGPVANTWSFAELRYQAKQTFHQFLQKHLSDSKTSTFLNSLVTADLEDRSLRFAFGRLGLQHILAISGFHFAILITFCTFFLRFCFPYKWQTITLLILINLYFIFVGSMPAVQRSWLTASLYLIGKLIGRHTTGLNLLGFSLLIEVLLDPLITSHLGFQLSFLSCAGILLLYPFFLSFFHPTFLNKTFALNLAVNTAIFPIILYYFHSFPLLSLLYNLFVPFLVSVSMFSLLFSLFTYLLFPPLSSLFFKFTNLFTTHLLDLISYPPVALDYSLNFSSLPAFLIPFYIFGLLLIHLSYRRLKYLSRGSKVQKIFQTTICSEKTGKNNLNDHSKILFLFFS